MIILDGAIICKGNGIVTVITTGEYSDLENKLSYYEKITPGKLTKLVSTDGINIEEIIRNQEKIEQQFGNVF